MRKVRIVNTIDYIAGGEGDLIFYGKADDDTPVKFWIDAGLIEELAGLLILAGHPGHAMWHRHNPSREIPCDDCKSNTK